MAKFPFTVTGTKVVNPDFSITINLSIKNGNNVEIATASPRFNPSVPPDTLPISRLIELIKTQVRQAMNEQFTIEDLPASFSFSFNPIDLL